jgi:hypothetical protein
MKILKNKLLIGLLLVDGVVCFVFGQIILSATILAATSIFTNKLTFAEE